MQYDYRNMTSQTLVELAKKGDQTAFRAIYERFSAQVRSRVSGYFVWVADVDDVVSVTFQKFFAKLDSFDSSREVLPWLMKIASRTALDHLDVMRREDEKKEGLKSKDTEMGDEGRDIITDINPEDEIISNEDHDRLMAFLKELPPIYGEVMQKYMVEELEYEKIAEELGLELNTVRTRIRRGKEKLAEMMQRGEIE